MKGYVVIIFITVISYSACNQTVTGPTSEIVKSEKIPRPFSEDIYFLFGSKLDKGEKPVFDQLLKKGFKIRNVWVPYSFGDCMSPLQNQMILQLTYPDSRIYSFGFMSDSTKISFYCIESWKSYKFEQ